MRAIIQRVSSSGVTVDGVQIASGGKGLLILIGITHSDDKSAAEFLAEKSANLRIFEQDGKMNISLLDIGGDCIVVPNFTLYSDCRRGRRPSFTDAAKPDVANDLFLHFCDTLESIGVKNVGRGEFGADMKVELAGDGPVTIILDTAEIMK